MKLVDELNHLYQNLMKMVLLLLLQLLLNHLKIHQVRGQDSMGYELV